MLLRFARPGQTPLRTPMLRSSKRKENKRASPRNLPGLDKVAPYQFSGGMRQRVMIAMALACHPQLLIADEPTSALDVTIRAQILDLMRDLRRQTGASMILITHDLAVVADIADHVLVMYAGRILESASAAELFRNPQNPYTPGPAGMHPGPLAARRQTGFDSGTAA